MPSRHAARAASLVLCCAALSFARSASALERTSAQAPEGDPGGWTSAGTCSVRYYNICTGWVWVWSGWSSGERNGTAFHGCCASAVLTLTNHLTFSGIGCGWGFTGTIEVYAADTNECPTGPPLARQPWLPPTRSGWYANIWNVTVPRDFVVQITWGSQPGFSNSTGLSSDHPAAGPTGPQACGVCFPSTRTARSYEYGFAHDPLCPGQRVNDGVCDVEFLMDAHFVCPVHVEEESWTKIKSLYR